MERVAIRGAPPHASKRPGYCAVGVVEVAVRHRGPTCAVLPLRRQRPSQQAICRRVHVASRFVTGANIVFLLAGDVPERVASTLRQLGASGARVPARDLSAMASEDPAARPCPRGIWLFHGRRMERPGAQWHRAASVWFDIDALPVLPLGSRRVEPTTSAERTPTRAATRPCATGCSPRRARADANCNPRRRLGLLRGRPGRAARRRPDGRFSWTTSSTTSTPTRRRPRRVSGGDGAQSLPDVGARRRRSRPDEARRRTLSSSGESEDDDGLSTRCVVSPRSRSSGAAGRRHPPS